jgi:hypothetical protein
MAEYMLLVLEDEEAHASQSPKAMADLIDARAQFAGALRRAGQLRDGGRLRPSKEGKRVLRNGDRLQIQSGPFAEDAKTLAAYYWVEAPNVGEAAMLAAECPSLESDEVDVRPLMKGKVDVDKETKPGKIFAFGVLGNATTEEAWVKVMDRIEAETLGRFGGDGFLGGVRLQPPKSGRRVATRGEKRVAFDGPFLEAKEVIGGAFFRRMTSMDEAVRWAAETPFVVHGALEIRELWRT